MSSLRIRSARVRRFVRALSPACAALPFLLAACSGGSTPLGGPQTSGPATSGPELVGTQPEPVGLLDARSVTWRSDVSGAYTVELRPRGSGVVGAVIDSGTIEGGGQRTVNVHGTSLELEQTAALIVSVVDAGGKPYELQVDLDLEPLQTFFLPNGNYRDITYVDERELLVAAAGYTGLLRTFDVEPESSTFGQNVGIFPPGPDVGPYRFAAASGAETGWALYGASLLELELETLLVRSVVPSASLTPISDIALVPDGDRGYVPAENALLMLDAEPVAGAPTLSTCGVFGTITGGNVAITYDGSLALVAWYFDAFYGVWVVDVDPESLTYNSIVARPLEELLGPVAKVAIAPDDSTAYAGGVPGTFIIDLDSPSFDVLAYDPERFFDGIEVVEGASTEVVGAPAGDQTFVLQWLNNGPLRVFDAELELVGEIPVGTLLLDRGAVDRTGERLFLVRNTSFPDVEVVVVPLR